jgi:hypothetical protein
MRVAVALAMLLLTSCDGHFRYPCQDPQNFGKAECNPPLCELNGECTKDLINKDLSEDKVEQITEVVPDNPDEETNGMNRMLKMEAPMSEVIESIEGEANE